MLTFDTWVEAVAVANGRAVLTGMRQEVWYGDWTRKWRVAGTGKRLQPLVAEPCS